MKDFYIEDVVATGRRKGSLKSIKPGDNVKVVLRLLSPIDNIEAERLWFKVIKVDGGNILAELDNDPLYVKSLTGTDRINLVEDNILEVLR